MLKAYSSKKPRGLLQAAGLFTFQRCSRSSARILSLPRGLHADTRGGAEGYGSAGARGAGGRRTSNLL